MSPLQNPTGFKALQENNEGIGSGSLKIHSLNTLMKMQLFNVKALDQLLLVLKNSVYDIPIIPLRGMSNPYERKGILCTLIKAIIDL